MAKKHRIIYFWVIFSITIIIIPLLLLYSSGYRYDFSLRKIVKTGSIFISTYPEESNIYLNNQPAATNTPILINNLFPNEYLVSIKKDGYFTWEKNLLVNFNKTTFANEIYLFKNNVLPEKIDQKLFPGNSITTIISPDIAAIISQLNLPSELHIDESTNGYLTILDQKNKTLYLIQSDNLSINTKKFSQSVNDFVWNQKNKNKLLFNNDLEIWVYDLEKDSSELITRQSEPIKDAIWFSDTYILLAEKATIKIIGLDSREPREYYELAKVNQATEIRLDAKEKNLFFRAENNYWKLNLQD